MRPVQIIDKPNMNPNVCIKCGSGPGSRTHFVDFGIDSVMHHEDHTGQHHITDGVIYFCSECMKSLINDYFGKVFQFEERRLGGIAAKTMGNEAAMKIQSEEVYHLKSVVAELKAELEKLRRAPVGPPPAEIHQDAKQVLDGLLGEEKLNESGTDDDGASSSPDDSDATGTVESNDGDDSADEPLTSSDIFDIGNGFLVAPANS